ncbi:hypothetical protein E4U30_008376, partial [Claviceps sp. LM220 group G6]
MQSYDTITVDAISPHLLNHEYASYLIHNLEDRAGHAEKAFSTNGSLVIRTQTQTDPGQAQLWTQIYTFEMDMNFKKVHPKKGTVEHEVIFGARVGLEAQFLVLARAYMSSQDSAVYEVPSESFSGAWMN